MVFDSLYDLPVIGGGQRHVTEHLRRMRSYGSLAVVTVVALLSGACSSLEVIVSETEFEVIEDVVFEEGLAIDLELMTRLESGVYIQDVVVGEGSEIGATSTAEATFTGWLRTGLIFDQGQLEFTMGQQEVVLGLEHGMLGMRVGGTRLIIIPPALGYGSAISGSIPPGSILVVEVELLAVT